jgi:hypothetical protein
MQTGNRRIALGVFCLALAGGFLVDSARALAADKQVVVRPAIRITVSPGSTPTARFVQYGYYSGGWGWGNSYRGWGGYGWGGYGGWGAYGGLPYYGGWGGYAPVYGSFYGGYLNYGYPLFDYGYFPSYWYPGYGFGGYGYGYPVYGYPAHGYPAYGGYPCGCGYGCGFYDLGYRIW